MVRTDLMIMTNTTGGWITHIHQGVNMIRANNVIIQQRYPDVDRRAAHTDDRNRPHNYDDSGRQYQQHYWRDTLVKQLPALANKTTTTKASLGFVLPKSGTSECTDIKLLVYQLPMNSPGEFGPGSR